MSAASDQIKADLMRETWFVPYSGASGNQHQLDIMSKIQAMGSEKMGELANCFDVWGSEDPNRFSIHYVKPNWPSNPNSRFLQTWETIRVEAGHIRLVSSREKFSTFQELKTHLKLKQSFREALNN